MKWKNRSEEDKKRIHEEQVTLRTKTKKQLLNPKDHKDIIDSGDIPLTCPIHGWVNSDKYSQANESPGLGMPSVFMIRGKCPKCGREAKKAIVSIDELTIYSLLIMKMTEDGRMTG